MQSMREARAVRSLFPKWGPDNAIIIYIPLSRVGKGWKVNIREFHFPVGFRDFFMLIPSRALARDGISMKKSRNPKGK